MNTHYLSQTFPRNKVGTPCVSSDMIRFYPHQLFRQEQRPQGRPIQAGCRFRSTARAGATLPLITISEVWLCRPNGLFEVKASRLTNPERLHISIAYRRLGQSHQNSPPDRATTGGVLFRGRSRSECRRVISAGISPHRVSLKMNTGKYFVSSFLPLLHCHWTQATPIHQDGRLRTGPRRRGCDGRS